MNSASTSAWFIKPVHSIFIAMHPGSLCCSLCLLLPRRIDQGSPRSVGMRPSVCAVIEGRALALPSNGFVRPDSTSRSDCSSPGCQHGQTQARSVSLGRRQLSSGMTSRQLSNLDIKQRTDSSVSNLTRQLHVIL